VRKSIAITIRQPKWGRKGRIEVYLETSMYRRQSPHGTEERTNWGFLSIRRGKRRDRAAYFFFWGRRKKARANCSMTLGARKNAFNTGRGGN